MGPGQVAVAAEEEEQGVKQEGVKGNNSPRIFLFSRGEVL